MTKKIIFSLLALAMFSVILTSCDDSDPVAPHGDHEEASGFLIKDASGKIVFKEQKAQVDKSIATVFLVPKGDEPLHYTVAFLGEDGDVTTALEPHHTLVIEIDNQDFATVSIKDLNFTLTPLKTGETKFRVVILHEDHPDFTSPYYDMEIK